MRASLVAGAVVALTALLLAQPVAVPTRAGELLDNGGFESWSGDVPSGWFVSGGGTSKDNNALSGASLRLAQAATVQQGVAALPGARYRARIQAFADGTVVTLRLRFRDASLVELLVAEVTVAPGGTWTPIELGQEAPVGTAWVTFEVAVPSAGSGVLLDSASLDDSAPPPTPPPTATPTATPTPTATASTTTATATASVPPPTPTPARTATARPATPSPSITPRATGTTAPPPSPPAPVPGGFRPPPGIPSGFGGLLLNGDFELPDGEQPAYWSKVGGTPGIDPEGRRGVGGALDSNTTSTKWLYQVVSVDGGAWYRASGYARVRWGDGDALVRVSWYGSGDGSGAQMEQADSNTVRGASWQAVTTDAVQSPAGARSARVRLLLRPDGALASASFDDVVFEQVPMPAAGTPAVPTPTAGRGPGPAGTATPAATTADRGGTSPAGTATRAGGASPEGRTPAATPFFSVQTVAGPNTLRLSEVMPDPAESGREVQYEWVELVNVGREPVDLAGWKLGDGSEVDTLPAAQVAPGGFVVIGGPAVVVPAGVVLVVVPDGDIGRGLNNDGDVVRLVAPDGSEADVLSYGTNVEVFDPPPPAPPPGATLGVISAGGEAAPENWRLTARATPGEANQFPAARGASPSPSPGKGATPAGSGSPSAAGGEAAVVGSSGGGSSMPWVLTAFVAGLGLAGAAFGGQRYLAAWKGRRGGG